MNIESLSTCKICISHRYGKGYGSCLGGHQDRLKELGLKAAYRCPGFRVKSDNGIEQESDRESRTVEQINSFESILSLEEALETLLKGRIEFVFHSTKTGEDFRYRLTDKGDVHFVEVYEQDKYVYAGTIRQNDNDKRYRFYKGKTGTLEPSDVRIRSLVFVMDSLYSRDFDKLKLEIRI